MSDTGPNAGGPNNGSWQGDTWRSAGTPPRAHAFDPYAQPDLFRGVLMRRVVAFLIDLVVLSIPIVLAWVFILLFGVVTLGLGWALFWLISPATVIWPVVYYGMSLGGPHSATVGMRMMDLQMRTFSARRATSCLAPHTRSCSGPRCRYSRRWCWWSACSTAAVSCCTTSCWEPWW
jgi:hypothetical protein